MIHVQTIYMHDNINENTHYNEKFTKVKQSKKDSLYTLSKLLIASTKFSIS